VNFKDEVHHRERSEKEQSGPSAKLQPPPQQQGPDNVWRLGLAISVSWVSV
jgi:hypothetical protein